MNSNLSAQRPRGLLADLSLVGLLTFYYLLAMFDRMTLAIFVKPIKAQLHLSDFAVSLLLGPALALTYAFTGLMSGWASDRLSRRIVVLAGVLIWSAGTIACGLTTSFYGIFVARMIMGIGQSALIPAAYSEISQGVAKQRLATSMSIFSMAPQLGIAAAYALAGTLLAWGPTFRAHGVPIEAWQAAFIIAGIPGLVTAGFALLIPKRAAPMVQSEALDTVQIGGFVRQNRMLLFLLLVGFGSMTIVGGAVPLWVPTFLERTYGLNPSQFGPALGAVTIIGTLLLLCTGLLLDTTSRRGVKNASVRVYTWLLAGSLPVSASVFMASGVYYFYLGYMLLLGVTLSFMVFLSTTIARVIPAQFRGRITAAFLLIASILGLGISPTVVALLTDVVFRDPSKVGLSLATTVILGSVIALSSLRLSLRYKTE